MADHLEGEVLFGAPPGRVQYVAVQLWPPYGAAGWVLRVSMSPMRNNKVIWIECELEEPDLLPGLIGEVSRILHHLPYWNESRVLRRFEYIAGECFRTYGKVEASGVDITKAFKRK